MRIVMIIVIEESIHGLYFLHQFLSIDGSRFPAFAVLLAVHSIEELLQL